MYNPENMAKHEDWRAKDNRLDDKQTDDFFDELIEENLQHSDDQKQREQQSIELKNLPAVRSRDNKTEAQQLLEDMLHVKVKDKIHFNKTFLRNDENKAGDVLSELSAEVAKPELGDTLLLGKDDTTPAQKRLEQMLSSSDGVKAKLDERRKREEARLKAEGERNKRRDEAVRKSQEEAQARTKAIEEARFSVRQASQDRRSVSAKIHEETVQKRATDLQKSKDGATMARIMEEATRLQAQKEADARREEGHTTVAQYSTARDELNKRVQQRTTARAEAHHNAEEEREAKLVVQAVEEAIKKDNARLADEKAVQEQNRASAQSVIDIREQDATDSFERISARYGVSKKDDKKQEVEGDLFAEFDPDLIQKEQEERKELERAAAELSVSLKAQAQNHEDELEVESGSQEAQAVFKKAPEQTLQDPEVQEKFEKNTSENSTNLQELDKQIAAYNVRIDQKIKGGSTDVSFEKSKREELLSRRRELLMRISKDSKRPLHETKQMEKVRIYQGGEISRDTADDVHRQLIEELVPGTVMSDFLNNVKRNGKFTAVDSDFSRNVVNLFDTVTRLVSYYTSQIEAQKSSDRENSGFFKKLWTRLGGKSQEVSRLEHEQKTWKDTKDKIFKRMQETRIGRFN